MQGSNIGLVGCRMNLFSLLGCGIYGNMKAGLQGEVGSCFFSWRKAGMNNVFVLEKGHKTGNT